MAVGRYEQVIMQALEHLSSGPWTTSNLVETEALISGGFCGNLGPDCDVFAVLDWLRSLSEEDRDELILRANASRNQRPGT